MKLRKVGNSLGTTFSKDMLSVAGFTEEDDLEVIAAPGELRITKPVTGVSLELSLAEAKAIAQGKMDSPEVAGVVEKARRLVKRFK